MSNYQNIAKENDYEQLGFIQNGCISPCPHRDKCNTYNVGCKGGCYWCGMFDKKKIEEDDEE